MKPSKFFLLVILLSIIASKGNAKFNHPLVIGTVNNFIDSDLRTFQLYNLEEWNYVARLSHIHIEQKIFYGINLETIGSFNQLQKSLRSNGNCSSQAQSYHALDLLMKIPLSSFVNVRKYLDFFIHGGYGFASFTGKNSTVQPDLIAKSYNTDTHPNGLGLNTWVTPQVAVNLQSTAKF
jgi:hypothetical protein